jgi:MoaA/NifB/PqqE/SkfB family radical SAM enzyme
MADGTLPGPPRVQIQTHTTCNGRCIFCPNEAVRASDLEMGRMPEELFHKIIDELAETPPRRILPYLQNEPLIDTRMPAFVAYIAEAMPDTTTLITTNGTKLSAETGAALIDAGLKRLKVSLQSLDDEKNRAIMGYPASGVVENTLRFAEQIRRAKSKLDLRVSMVVTSKNMDELEETRKFWKKRGVRLVTSALENRGGNIADTASLNMGQEMVHCNNCIRPSRDMCILFNGQVILCCVDWFRTVVTGDLSAQTAQEVWNSEAMESIRRALAANDLQRLPPLCVNCTESACPDIHRRGAKTAWGQLKDAFLGPFTGRPA